MVLPGTDDVVIGTKTLREKLHIDVMQSLEAKALTAQVGVSFASSFAAHASGAGISVGSSLRLMSGPTVTLTGMETARVEADLQEQLDKLSGTSHTKRVASRCAIVGNNWTPELAAA